MPAVVLKQLSLQGFGRFKDKVTVEFTEGINVLAAPNESGKSTLMAGLTAVVFGLPASSDPTTFGISKYRNWEGPPTFSGELLFDYEQKLHQIVRDFDSQRVTVRRRSAGGWTEMVRGVHNPRASRPNERYLDFLDQVFGLRSAEMFIQTYFLGQPLPAAATLSTEVQQLLSGGGAHYSKVLDALMKGIKQITRYGNQYYAALNNGRKDQQLEELQAEKGRLEQAMRMQSQTTDDLEHIREEMVSCEQQRLDKLQLFRTKEAAVRGFEQWLALRDRLRAARNKLSNLQSATERAEELEKQMAAVKENATDAVSHALTLDICKLDDRLTKLSSFATLGAEPQEMVKGCRDWLHQKVQLYRQQQELRKEANKLKQDLQTDYASFEEAELPVLQKLPAYLVERPRLVAEAETANRALQRAQQDTDAMSILNAELTRQLGDPELISDAEIAELQLFCSGSNGARKQQCFKRVWWAPAIGMAISAALYLAWGRSAGFTGAITSLLPMLLSILALFLGRSSGQATDSVVHAGKHPSLSRLPVREVNVLLTKLQQYRLMVQQKAELLQEAQSRQNEANRRLLDGDAEFAGLVRQHRRLEHSFTEWRQLHSRLRDLTTQIQQLEGLLAYSTKGNCGFEGEPGRLHAVLALTGFGELQGEQLLAALDLQPAPWTELLVQVAEYVELVRQRADLAAKLSSHKHQQMSSADQARAALEAIFETNSCQNLDELQERLQDAREEVLLCRKEWKELLLVHPDLPELSQMEDGLLVANRRREISEQASMLQTEIEQLDQRIFTIKSQLGQLEGRQSINLAQAMELLTELNEEEQRLLEEANVLGLAASELSAAIAEFQQSYRDRLAERMSSHFQSFTGDGARSVAVDNAFALQVQNGDGQLVSPAQLSQGAQDQLYLAVRLAIADLTAENTEPPLVLDDPLLTSDQDRLSRMRCALERLRRQVILLSHQSDFASWGTPVRIV